MSKPSDRFRVIEGGPSGDGKAKPRRFRAKKPGDIEPLICPRCDSNASEYVVLGRMLKNGKPVGGTKQLRCADCKTPLL